MSHSSLSSAALALTLLLGGCSPHVSESGVTERPVIPGQLPDTLKRTAMMDKIIEAGVQSIEHREPNVTDRQPISPALLEDESVADRKAFLGSFTLPEDYWNQFRQNFRLFYKGVTEQHARTLGIYRDKYRSYLRDTESAVLEQWLQPVGPAVRTRVAAIDSLMAQFYRDTNEKVGRDTIEDHVKRMNQLDQRFGVCAHFPLCVLE